MGRSFALVLSLGLLGAACGGGDGDQDTGAGDGGQTMDAGMADVGTTMDANTSEADASMGRDAADAANGDARAPGDAGGEDAASSQCVASFDIDIGSATGDAVAEGTSDGLENRLTPSCVSASNASDFIVRWTAPSTRVWDVDTTGSSFDTVLHIRDANCEEIACDDDGGGDARSRASIKVNEGDTVYIVVDGYQNQAGVLVVGIYPGESTCDDGLDNDADGETDCIDPSCGLAAPSLCIETLCHDLQDNDGDGRTDCADPDCAPLPDVCTEVTCNDNGDNDGDGVTDCADPDCANVPDICSEVSCHDGIDNDNDTYADCLDSDCLFADPTCTETVCDDGVDNNADGSPDCRDVDCRDLPTCREGQCTDGVDNNGDLRTDCADPDCFRDPSCVETNCGNQMDDDGDGLIDCDDGDCGTSAPECGETSCGNGGDDDGDGYADCDDMECNCSSSCPPSDVCPETDLGSAVGYAVATGSNSGTCDSLRPETGLPDWRRCLDTRAGSGGELTFAWTAPSAGTYQFDTNGSNYDTVVYVLDASCSGAQIMCDDDGGDGLQSRATVTVSGGQSLVIVLDAYSTASIGVFVLNITDL